MPAVAHEQRWHCPADTAEQGMSCGLAGARLLAVGALLVALISAGFESAAMSKAQLALVKCLDAVLLSAWLWTHLNKFQRCGSAHLDRYEDICPDALGDIIMMITHFFDRMYLHGDTKLCMLVHASIQLQQSTCKKEYDCITYLPLPQCNNGQAVTKRYHRHQVLAT